MPTQVTKAASWKTLSSPSSWKWVAAGIAEGVDQVPDDASEFVERLNHSVEGVVVIPLPFGGSARRIATGRWDPRAGIIVWPRAVVAVEASCGMDSLALTVICGYLDRQFGNLALNDT